MSTPSHLTAQPLVWGHGPRTFEVFLEPTCPFSVRAFNKLDDLLDEVGADNVTIKFVSSPSPGICFPASSCAAFSPLPPCRTAGSRRIRCLKPSPTTAKSLSLPTTAAGQTWTPRRSRLSSVSNAIATFRWLRRLPARSCKTRSNGTASMPARTASTCRRPLWLTAWCRRISAAATTSAYGPRGFWLRPAHRKFSATTSTPH